MTLAQITKELKHLNLRNGGKWYPNKNSLAHANAQPNRQKNLTNSRLRLAIIVPYRDRLINLHLFLFYMHQFLTRQNVYYGIYLVEPLNGLKFNRAMLINIGFVESLKEEDHWNCFIFHDVDMLPESEQNIYGCDWNFPRQMAIAVNINSYS